MASLPKLTDHNCFPKPNNWNKNNQVGLTPAWRYRRAETCAFCINFYFDRIAIKSSEVSFALLVEEAIENGFASGIIVVQLWFAPADLCGIPFFSTR